MNNGAIKLVKARKEYRCTERNYHTIAKGSLHLYAAMPPWHEMNRSRKSDPGGRRWWVIRVCLRCANEFGMHTSETRQQADEAKVAEQRAVA